MIDLDDIQFTEEYIVILPNKLLKQSRPGYQPEKIVLKSYAQDENVCIVKTLKTYVNRTKNLRTDRRLLIGTISPHKPVTKSTVSRWVKLVLQEAGIDSSFGAHSTRAASTSKASLKGVPLDIIIKTAGWSNAKTFAQFYQKRIETNPSGLQEAILGK